MAEPMGPPDQRGPDQIWSFRGYKLSPSEFNTAMVHFYRGEMSRANVWRTRLDMTTNWAVVAAGAALSFTFTDPMHSHIMIPIDTILITLFLYIEARRYRYYELWAYRVRLMETDFFSAMLAPPFQPSKLWATQLTDNLQRPTYTITFWEAFGRRFRRNYQFIYLLLAVAWFAKLLMHPTAAHSLGDVMRHAAIGPIPGEVVLGVGFLFNLTLFLLGWGSAGLRASKGEVVGGKPFQSPIEMVSEMVSDLPLMRGRNEQMAHIITDSEHGQQIADRVMSTMGRGVTGLEGRGMYTGASRLVLITAVHPEQVAGLKRLVHEIDPNTFVVIHSAEQVIGEGFRAPS